MSRRNCSTNRRRAGTACPASLNARASIASARPRDALGPHLMTLRQTTLYLASLPDRRRTNLLGTSKSCEVALLINDGRAMADPAMSSQPFRYLRAAGLLPTVLGRIRKLFRFAVSPKEPACFCRRLVRPLHLPRPRRELRNGSPWIVFDL